MFFIHTLRHWHIMQDHFLRTERIKNNNESVKGRAEIKNRLAKISYSSIRLMFKLCTFKLEECSTILNNCFWA